MVVVWIWGVAGRIDVAVEGMSNVLYVYFRSLMYKALLVYLFLLLLYTCYGPFDSILMPWLPLAGIDCLSSFRSCCLKEH